MGHYLIREVEVKDAVEWKRLRIEALNGEPQAFAMSPETVEAKSDSDLREDIRKWQESGGFVLGAFSQNGQLLGIVGVSRSPYPKLCHRGHVWGVYVTPSERGAGIAKNLFAEVISRSQLIPDLVQLDIEAVTSNTRALSYIRLRASRS